ncbi:tetratricopeptide repeat protein [Geomonas sp. Red32]|uniref:CheR family methyltransferase n=1 Tax=Geomonas sp. Red32 TaxID=2912856 RepID=UPI00202CF466|nr:CheR family methyltransferase [Geomonas sp. Red32]MCM0083290.1 tetratricopeptide repeat protein [Geomonas sp. Red32]
MRTLSDQELARLCDLFARHMGLSFPKERWNTLDSSLAAASRRFNFGDPRAFAAWLLSSPLNRQQVEVLAGYLTIGETYFFRDPRTLDVAQKELFPPLIAARRWRQRRLRIWSAGCSSGEEPYTLAILLDRMLPDIARWNITILATDFNPNALAKGVGGRYGKWSFRATPAWFREQYFESQREDEYRVADRVRRMVSFAYLNLADDRYPSLVTNTNAMDVIFCRNVLMYFTPDVAREVASKLERSLADDGWLVLGPAESLPRGFLHLKPVSFGGIVAYHKRPRQAAVPPTPEAPREFSEAVPGAAVREENLAVAKSPPPAFSAAASLFRLGEYAEAVEQLEGVDKAGGLTPDGRFLLVRALANGGRLDEALAACDAALSEEKLDPALHVMRAEILQEKGDGTEAQVSLQRALYLDPELVPAHFALGNLALWSGDIPGACRHFDNARRLLDRLPAEAEVPGSEGMSAGRLREVLDSMAICTGSRTGGR